VFLQDLGSKSRIRHLIRVAFHLLGLMTFFNAGPMK
jgi:ribosome-binding ATPase YchF (GTP1/OBG family)